MKKSEEKCVFLDEYFEEGDIKELILRGYRILPLSSDGILVLNLGGEK